MAKRVVETGIELSDAISSKGTVTIKEGQLKGVRGRTVVLEATPAPGYVFDGWEVENVPFKLRVFGQVAGRVASVEAICGNSTPTTSGQLTTTLYTDGTALYTDEQGNFEAATGYWDAGNGQYLFYDGSVLPVVQPCSPPTITSSVSSLGGGPAPRPGIARNVVDTYGNIYNEREYMQMFERDNLDNAVR